MPIPLVRWTFYDPVDDETYTFEVNPSAGNTPGVDKQLTTVATAAPDGRTLIFEGRDNPQALEFSGTLYTQAQYEAFMAWADKRHQIKVTDDLSREFWVYIEKFTPTRARSYQHPWRHTYTVRAPILDHP